MAKTPPSGTEKAALVLFRDDLRVGDNRALAAAAQSGRPVVCAFVLDETATTRPRGAARRWWLHHSLQALDKALAELGGTLILRSGPQDEAVARLVEEIDAGAVFWNRRYDPSASAADAALREALRRRGILVESFDGQLLHEPSLVKTGAGTPYKVYTPFWRALTSGPEPRDPVAAPKELRAFRKRLKSDDLRDWRLLPTSPDWSKGISASWTPGEAGALKQLEAFLDDVLDGYQASRELPAVEGSSRLSPHLANGEISPYQILGELRRRSSRGADATLFRKELAWREFCHHLLFHNPDLHRHNYNRAFDRFAWRSDARALKAWQAGRTGYPIVDAGMRQLWQTGWMHNRVRMVAASFLVKHLLIDWREGESWFWDTLVDADAANNPGNWQWVAGSGADASPFFRVFNPILQGEKFDPDGDYVRRFVPELGNLPTRYLHRPWEAPGAVLSKARVTLGKDYPEPLVAHEEARQRALDALRSMRGA